jgi:glycosyltransferase involved in cell wall biosynthesis
MKILMLTPYLPYPLLSGGQIRTYNLLKQLADKHEITLFALIKDSQEKKYIKDIEPFCKKIKVFKRSSKAFTIKNILKTAFSSFPFLVIRNYVPEAVRVVKQELSSQQYDLIHSETFYMMPHIPQTKTPILLVEQTIEYLGYESYAEKVFLPLRILLNYDVHKIRKWERYYWKQAQKLIAMSEDDKKYIQQHLNRPQKVEVISNGVDAQWFAAKPQQPPKNPTVIYVGTFKWLPNVEAVQYLVKKIWPKVVELSPNAKLKIIGNEPTQEIINYGIKNKNIEITGRVPDIRDAFKKAHVLLAPVLSGKGTRYKILEAMASGTPIVATKTAVEGLNLKHNEHVLISNDPQTLAEYVDRLLNDQKLWKKLSLNGKRFVKKNYDWQLISKKLDKIYQSM